MRIVSFGGSDHLRGGHRNRVLLKVLRCPCIISGAVGHYHLGLLQRGHIGGARFEAVGVDAG